MSTRNSMIPRRTKIRLLFAILIVVFGYFLIHTLLTRNDVNKLEDSEGRWRPKLIFKNSTQYSYYRDGTGGQSQSGSTHTAPQCGYGYDSQQSKCSLPGMPVPGTKYDLDDMLRKWAQKSFRTAKSVDHDVLLEESISPEKTVVSELTKLQIFILPFSHSDPGWLNTVEGYFLHQTKYTLDNMLAKLTVFKDMTFLWTETVFFAMWWKGLNRERRQMVKSLLTEGRLEIAGGGWVMPDEANAHYFGIIDQFIEGHQWLLDNVGIVPENSWSLDPFGYSSTLPYIMKHSGIKNMLIQRVHYMFKTELGRRRALEFRWRQEWDPTGSEDMLCHVTPYKLYAIKYACGPDTFVCLQYDFRKIPMEHSESRSIPIDPQNIAEKASALIEQLRLKAKNYIHNVVLMPLGDDFRYDRSLEWDQQYTNFALLVGEINKRPDLNAEIRFGTLKDYFDAVHKRASNFDSFPAIKGDFFPYADDNYDYWTGYFTTRPFSKGYVRYLESRLRAAEILASYAHNKKYKSSGFITDAIFQNLTSARQYIGMFQHHDAITGTSRFFVVKDYLMKLYSALVSIDGLLRDAFQAIISQKYEQRSTVDMFIADDTRSDEYSLPKNFLIDVESKDSPVYLYLYNSLATWLKPVVTVNVDSVSVSVRDFNQHKIPSQVNPVFADNGIFMHGSYELAFVADLPPLSLVRYTLLKSSADRSNLASVQIFHATKHADIPDFHIEQKREGFSKLEFENDYMIASFAEPCNLNSVKLKCGNGVKVDADLRFLYYTPRGSGAYLFNPVGEAEYFAGNSKDHANAAKISPVVRILRGPVMSQMHCTFRDVTLSHKITMYHTRGVEATSLDIVNEIDATREPNQNKEIIMRLLTNIDNQRVFHTDLNGFKMAHRETIPTQPIEANYYPITAMAVIEDATTRMTIHTSQAHGATSLRPGELEVMLERSTFRDDNRGLGGGVHQLFKTAIRLKLQFESKNDKQLGSIMYPSITSHLVNRQLNHPVIKFVSSSPVSGEASHFQPIVKLMESELPCDIHLVNIRNMHSPQKGSRSSAVIIHRQGYDCNFYNMACKVMTPSIRMADLFRKVNVKSVSETSLTMMHKYKDLNVDQSIDVQPMQIRVFNVTFT